MFDVNRRVKLVRLTIVASVAAATLAGPWTAAAHASGGSQNTSAAGLGVLWTGTAGPMFSEGECKIARNDFIRHGYQTGPCYPLIGRWWFGWAY